MPHRFEHIDWKRTIAQFGDEFLRKQHQNELEQNQIDFERLRSNLSKGICYLCNQPLSHIDTNKPCLHWFINPLIDIKLLKERLQQPLSYFRLYTYLTWVANTEVPFVNINDIEDYNHNKKIFEGTIRYRNIEWSFSLGKSDFEGHHTSIYGKASHYHLQLKIDGKTQIKYRDTHVPFTSEDLLCFELIKQGAMEIDPSFSMGSQELLNHVEVVVCSDNSAIFMQQISHDTLYKTVVLHITKEQLKEIDDLYSTTKLQIHEIIDKLNQEKGYNIKYLVYESIREDAVKKYPRK